MKVRLPTAGHLLTIAAVLTCVRIAQAGGDLAGRAIYERYCYQCHGYAGDAKASASRYLDPRPRDFTAASPERLTRGQMLDAVTRGKAGTAMMSFAGVLRPAEIEAAVDYVRDAFMNGRRSRQTYHTAENGWPQHERYAAAFPFASGEIPLDRPWEDLSATQQQGRRLFMSACVTCHDGTQAQDASNWEPRPLSYPRNGYSSASVDATTQATPYRRHEAAPAADGLTIEERVGERLFQRNCAFCHAPDGTGRNWIGSFMDPHPRDLTDPAAMRKLTTADLHRVIEQGLAGNSMPAWKNVLSGTEIDAVIAYVRRVFHPDDTVAAGTGRLRTQPPPAWERVLERAQS